MEDKENKGDPNFDSLVQALREIEIQEFGEGNLPDGIDEVRTEMIGTLRTANAPRLQKGSILGRYKRLLSGETTWKSAQQEIALRFSGYKSRTSVNSLIANAEHAANLPEPMLAAMMENRLDPAQTMYCTLVDELLALQFTGGIDTARELFRRVYQEFRERKRADSELKRANKEEATKTVPGRMVRMAQESVRLLPAEEKPHTLVKVVCNLVEQLRQDIFPYTLELTVSSPESPPVSMESAPSHNSNSVKLPLGKFEVISSLLSH